MVARARTLLAPVLAAFALSSCFPELPNVYEIADLRVLAVQSDPATALLDVWPPPVVTLRALVVDPQDPEGEGITHRWSLELGDDFEGADELREALIPDGPHGAALTLNLGALFGARDGGWTQGLLPFRYRAENGSTTRDAVKLASFLVPEVAGDDDDSASGDDDDSAQGDDDDSADPARELPGEFNMNPRLASVGVVGGATYSIEAGTLPGRDAPLYLGEVSAEDGLHLRIEVIDDKDPDEVSAALFWTHGEPGLPSPPGAIPGADDDDDGAGGFGGFGESAVIGDWDVPREFGWTPPEEAPNRPVRLFLILLDEQGGQSWQELRPAAPPAR